MSLDQRDWSLGQFEDHKPSSVEYRKSLELLQLLEAKAAELKTNKLATIFPDDGPYARGKYPEHIAFINASAHFSELAFIAANRVGKSLTAAYIMAIHATGLYPEWWEGRKFKSAPNMLAIGITNDSVKDVQQTYLLGDIMEIGTGLIPKDLIVRTSRKSGVTDAIESCHIKHASGGVSKITFGSYTQGRQPHQGKKYHLVWCDEEPEVPGLYSELVTRTMGADVQGIMMCTFTPLLGLSDISLSFLPDGLLPHNGVNPQQPHKFAVQIGWDKAPHLTEEEKARMLATYQPHERAARSKGIPGMGAGVVYPYDQETYVVDPFPIPEYWEKCYGLDVGWNTTAGVWLAKDPSTGIVYVYSEHYAGREVPAIHASAIKARGEWIPGVVDPASKGSSQAEGKTLLELYLREGLDLEMADNSVDAGIYRVQQLFETRQLKIFATCKFLLAELRIYRRGEDGKIVKKRDHAVDALRYAVMSGLDIAIAFPDPDDMEYTSHYAVNGRDKLTGY